jgi:hypothetical protein
VYSRQTKRISFLGAGKCTTCVKQESTLQKLCVSVDEEKAVSREDDSSRKG